MTDADLILTLRDDVKRLRERHFSILADRMELVANVLEARGAQLERANVERKGVDEVCEQMKAAYKAACDRALAAERRVVELESDKDLLIAVSQSAEQERDILKQELEKCRR